MLEMYSYAYSTRKTIPHKPLEPSQLRAFVFLDTTVRRHKPVSHTGASPVR